MKSASKILLMVTAASAGGFAIYSQFTYREAPAPLAMPSLAPVRAAPFPAAALPPRPLPTQPVKLEPMPHRPVTPHGADPGRWSSFVRTLQAAKIGGETTGVVEVFSRLCEVMHGGGLDDAQDRDALASIVLNARAELDELIDVNAERSKLEGVFAAWLAACQLETSS